MHRAAYFGLALLLILASGCERRQHLVEQHLLEFGTLIKISLIATDLARAQALLDEVEIRLEDYRRQWHAWEDSELTRFNRALRRGEAVPVPPDLAELLRLSREYHLASDGLFNPALGGLIAAYGFHGGEFDAAEVARLRTDIPTLADLDIDGGIATSRHAALQLDFGGIAKGYAVALIAELLDSAGFENYLVNAGGDLIASGNRLQRPWRIGIQNPYAPGVIASIELDGKYSLFTSGNYQRSYRRGGDLSHHIIDPRSGAPSRGQSSATVLTRDPVLADVAATVLMIDGARKAADLALSLGIEDFLVVSETRELLVSRSMADKLQISSSWPLKIVN